MTVTEEMARRVKEGPTEKEPRPIEADSEDDDAVTPGGVKKGCVEVGEVPLVQKALNQNDWKQ